MRKITYLILLAFSVLLFCCEDPNKDKDFAIFDGVSVGNWLENNPEFSLWTALLERTNLLNSLTVKNTFTCFAAKNSAVMDYLKKKNCASINDLDIETARYLMRYHTVVGLKIEAAAMSNGKLADTTASGDYLVTKYTEGSVIYVNDSSRIVTKDLQMVNGVLHVLDRVLDPVMDPVWKLLEETPEYSLFAEAVKKTGYDKKLSEIRLNTGAKSYTTLFVVSNDVFHANQVETFEDLVDLYAFGRTDYTDSTNLLNKYVAYHMIQGVNSFNDLAKFDTEKKLKNVTTYASNELIMIEDIKGILHFNKDEDRDGDGVADGGYLLRAKYNLQARNGLVHEIDGLMPVYSPDPTTFKLEFTDASYFPEFASLSWYHKSASAGQGKTDYINMQDQNQFPYIRWKTVPEGGGSVWYETRNTWGGFFDNADVLAANMGAVGWWEMDLPAIVKGKYKVSFKHHLAHARGTYQVAFDGKNVGAPVVFGKANTYTNKITDLGVVNFAETNTHTIRFTVVAPGVMELDYITFEPVK